ncbi:GumC family protein [Sulfuricurvum sp.]|uniref:GumC family protein n=1 Tax=Sulfuricurvum sp. TaxID=2025608 RepID=UPI002D3ACD33|nr:polysaccharide biosynthesis tyrosine autokinase [Sulfuricurvum sp.]HZF69979.1 polysaccharide biosynthesis tyrosine autokinase [Sulfuricurvum sp.]
MSSYSNNSESKQNIVHDGMELQDIATLLMRYKVSIISVALAIFLLTTFFAVFKSNVYQADLKMQIQADGGKTGNEADDLIAKAWGVQTSNLQNEIAIIQSRSLIQKALEHVQLGTQYYVSGTLKTVELYKNSPFNVSYEYVSKRAQSSVFKVKQINKNEFELSITPSLKTKIITIIRSFFGGVPEEEKPIYYSQIFSYGSPISHPDFKLTIVKTGEMSDKNYFFTITPNEEMYNVIQLSLTVSEATNSDPLSGPGNILLLSYKDSIPERAEEILNTLAEAYTDRSIEVKEAAAKQRLKFIDEQLVSINNSLQNSATHLKNYKTEKVVIDLNDKARIASSKLDQLETKLSDLDMQQSVLKNLLNYLNSNKEITGIDVGATDIATSPILSLIEKIQAANTQYSSLLVEYTEKHPAVIQIKEQIASLKASLRGTLESSLRGIDQRKDTLKEIIKSNKEALEGMPEEEQQLSELTRSFMVNDKVFQYLLEKRIETAIAKSSTVSGVRVIDSALTNVQPVEPKRLIIITIGLILGIILGLTQAFVRNLLANTIQSMGDLIKHTNLPLFATLPFYGPKKTLYEDSLRVLLTKLEFMPSKPQVITITSSVQGEGRTTTALEFATIIGKSGKKVIILDMDMRGSGINKKLNLDNKGISALLSGASQLEDVVHNIALNTYVIASGSTPSNPYELIMSKDFDLLLKRLKDEYDYIILESPPAGLVADALVLMRLSDLCLVVFKAQYSRKDFIYNMNRFVAEHNLENVGLILNGLELKKIRPWLRK